MKEDMMVVGINAVDNETIELQLVPLGKLKPKANVLEAAMSGDIKQVMEMAQQSQQRRNIIYRTRQWCSDNNIIPFRHITLEIELGDMAKKRMGLK